MEKQIHENLTLKSIQAHNQFSRFIEFMKCCLRCVCFNALKHKFNYFKMVCNFWPYYWLLPVYNLNNYHIFWIKTHRLLFKL